MRFSRHFFSNIFSRTIIFPRHFHAGHAIISFPAISFRAGHAESFRVSFPAISFLRIFSRHIFFFSHHIFSRHSFLHVVGVG